MESPIKYLKPFITLSVFKSEEATDLVDEVSGILSKLCETLRYELVLDDETHETVHNLKVFDENGFYAKAAWYSIKSAPSWFGAGDEDYDVNTDNFIITDVRNHLVIMASYKNHIILYSSQDLMRDRLNELIRYGFVGVKKKVEDHEMRMEVRLARTADSIPKSEMEKAFVKGEAKGVWMIGIHPSTVLKADRKILTGPNLRYAFDSFGDQTFDYSAAISEFDLGGKYRVGISFSKNTVWRKQSQNFMNFVQESKDIINILTGSLDNLTETTTETGFLDLASSSEQLNLDGVYDGFEIGYEKPLDIEKELISGGATENYQIDDDWQRNGYFKVKENVRKTSGSKIVADAFYKGEKITRVQFKPVVLADQRIEVKAQVLKYYTKRKDDKILVEFDRSLSKRNKQMTLRYGSGHVIQGNKLYNLHLNDVIFESWNWINPNLFGKDKKIDLRKEKPEKNTGKNDKSGKAIMVFDPKKIGSSNSLFCFTLNNIKSVIGESYVKDLSKGYLILCDDGGGELADFILLDPESTSKSIVFIHIKGIKNDSTHIYTGKLPDLCNMATKNIIYLHQGNLLSNLMNRTTDNNKGLVWKTDGKKSSRKYFIDKLSNMREGSAKHVVLFQPFIRKSVWEKTIRNYRAQKTNVDIGRMRQLTAILSETEMNLKKLGCTLSVVGINDTI